MAFKSRRPFVARFGDALAKSQVVSADTTGKPRRTFREYVTAVRPNYSWARHCCVLADVLQDVVDGKKKRVMVFEPPRHGKALAVNTPIPTPDGWKPIGKLKAGDTVFADDGKPTRVKAVSPVWRNRPVFRVTTDDGCFVHADAEHEWVVRLCRKKKAWTVRTTGYLARRTSVRNPLVRMAGSLDLPDAELPVGPYTLGTWLGDGRSSCGFVTMAESDQAFVRPWIESEGLTTRSHANPINFGVLGLQAKLRSLGLLDNKRIPPAYLRASRPQRLALLQGLIDTDGRVAPDGQVEFCAINLELAEGVCELVHSLGVKASFIHGDATLNGEYISEKYRVMFYMEGAARLPRKAERCRNGVKSPGRFLTFEEAGTADTVCIEVEAESHQFLCGNGMLVTHNSELVSRLLPAYYLDCYPDRWTGLSCYGQQLANTMSRSARMNYLAGGGKVSDAAAAVQHWETDAGGGMWAAGIGGPILGKGWNLGIIDDPIKNAEEAMSEVVRESQRDWYDSVFLSREQAASDGDPDGAIVLMHQRWHLSDLPGWLLDREKAGEDVEERWHVVFLPAIATGERPDYIPDTCTVEPEWRQPGEALWPERRPLSRLRKTQALNPYYFAAMYQQSPVIDAGEFFTTFPVIDTLPAGSIMCRGWDKAGSQGKGDWTAGVKIAETPDGKYVIADVVRGRWASDERERAIRDTATKDGVDCWIYLEQEGGSGGKDSAGVSVKNLAGFIVEAKTVTGDKPSRARALSAQALAGNVSLLRAEWNAAFEKEAKEFPVGSHDDQIDAASLAFNKLALMPRPGLGNVVPSQPSPAVPMAPVNPIAPGGIPGGIPFATW